MEEASALLVLEVHVAALHAAGEQDAVGALYEVEEVVAGAFHDGVVRVGAIRDPVL